MKQKLQNKQIVHIEFFIANKKINNYSANKMNRNHSLQQIKNTNANLRKSTSSDVFGSTVFNLDYIATILKCPICSNHAKQAHMCPNCCKLFCGVCIKNWIATKKPQCPNCIKPLRYTSAINCEALTKQIQDAIAKAAEQIKYESPSSNSQYEKSMSAAFSTPDLYSSGSQYSIPTQGFCAEHQLKLDYYCDVCSVSICSDCAVLSQKHQGHKLCKFSQRKVKFQEKINELTKKIKDIKKQFIKKRQEKNQIAQNIQRLEQQKREIFQGYLKKINEKTSQKINLSLQQKSQVMRQLQQKIANLTDQLQRIEKNVQWQRKGSLIKKAISYESQIQKIIDTDLKTLTIRRDTFDSQIVPIFGSKTFILDNYTYLRQKGDMLYSQPLFWKGIEWRLKIFPGGIDQQLGSEDQDKFLTIYLEMTKGHSYSNYYKYQILLINQLDRSKAIGCTFLNQFQQGTYWGLDRFANISFLYAQNFIHPIQGYLQIVLNVKSPTYFHAVKDQIHVIANKEQLLKERHQKLKLLRKQVMMKGLKCNEASSSWNVRALVDSQEPKLVFKRMKSISCIQGKKQRLSIEK